MSTDSLGNEIIVKGSGIGFQRRPGDEIDENKIDKVFVVANPEIRRKFHELIINIPSDCIEASEEIIELIKDNLKKEISDIIYVTLTDHISSMLERNKMGIQLNNTILWDVKRMYKEEYELGLSAVKIINQKFNIRLPKDEANFIALHIVNAELDTEMKQVYEITEMIDHIYQLVVNSFNIKLDEEDLSYNRFILHLKFFFERILKSKSEGESYAKNSDLLEILAGKYPKQYEAVKKISMYIYGKYQYSINSDEMLYLLIHITKMTT